MIPGLHIVRSMSGYPRKRQRPSGVLYNILTLYKLFSIPRLHFILKATYINYTFDIQGNSIDCRRHNQLYIILLINRFIVSIPGKENPLQMHVCQMQKVQYCQLTSTFFSNFLNSTRFTCTSGQPRITMVAIFICVNLYQHESLKLCQLCKFLP